MTAHDPTASPLGKTTAYANRYDASLLFPIARQTKRDELGLGATLPFFGVDVWHAYELSWLNARGKPVVAIGTFTVPADSPNLVESKSLKLYLNSLNNTRFDDAAAVRETIARDLSAAAGATVTVAIDEACAFGKFGIFDLDGLLLDRLDIDTDIDTACGGPDAALLRADRTATDVDETLVSHLLKSNCLVTGQPDWASVQIRYCGAPIDQEGLLRYLISFRNHNEFHEQCVERIFNDVLTQCRPFKLAVYARYTRRGGLDINPLRTNFNAGWPDATRGARQ